MLEELIGQRLQVSLLAQRARFSALLQCGDGFWGDVVATAERLVRLAEKIESDGAEEIMDGSSTKSTSSAEEGDDMIIR